MTIDRKKLEEAARLVERGVREGMFEVDYYANEWQPVKTLILGNPLSTEANSEFRWRIKPQAPREFWANYYPGGPGGSIHNTRDEADKRADSDRTECVRFREVLEGDGS